MIKEIYIDNFRCLVNFRIRPGVFQLWLGDNGSGKTSVLDALRNIQRILGGDHVQDIFPSHSATNWITKSKQEFGVTLEIAQEEYEYNLVIEHDKGRKTSRIKSEHLKWEGQFFYRYDGHDAHLYRINWNSGKAEEGATLSPDWGRSLIASLGEREDNKPLLNFREDVAKWLIVQPIPLVVRQVAESETHHLTRYAENFAQWYRHVIQEEHRVVLEAHKLLEDVLPGFTSLNLKESGDSRKLKVTFRINGKDSILDFQDISDGQRQLIVLYMISEAFRQGLFSTVFLDEPGNFVSLREVLPFIGVLEDVTDTTSQQAIVVSHHAEIINEMGHDGELWFSREEGAHTITTPYPAIPGLTPAQIMARGLGDV